MFVCHGNICRSPMAEFIFKSLASERGAAERFTVESSATSTEEIYRGVGNPVYPPARAELLRHGIDPRGKRARRLEPSDLPKYDMFIGMDQSNVRGMHSILGEGAKDKIYMLTDFFAKGTSIADPWYFGNFDKTYSDIHKGCTALLDRLMSDISD